MNELIGVISSEGELSGEVKGTGLRGEKGEDGYTPVKGVDYFDGIDGKDGRNGVDGKNGKDGVDGYTPVKGVDYFDGKDGYTPIKGTDYFDGETGPVGPMPALVNDLTTGGADAALAAEQGKTLKGLVDTNSTSISELTNSTVKFSAEQVLTTAQRLQARTNIGAAPVAGSYELIETITLTNDTASVVRTQEPDGTPYKFKAIGVVVSAEIGSVNSSINVLANYNATRLNAAYLNGAISTSTKRYGYTQIYSEFGVWTAIGSTSVNGFNWIVTQITGCSPREAFSVKESENPYCTQMVIQVSAANATIPAGTVISIYGVRA